MRYSLSSKFRGGLLGAALGNLIGLQYQRQISRLETIKLGFSSNLSKTELRIKPGAVLRNPRFDGQNFPMNHTGFSGKIALMLAQNLIQYNGVELEKWKDLWVKFSDSEITRINAQIDSQKLGSTAEFVDRKNSNTPLTIHTSPLIFQPGETAIATLPVAMFFHENKGKLRERLGEVAKVWQYPHHGRQDLVIGALAVGYAIARACKEKLDPATLIPETITYLGIDTPLTILLVEVQKLLEQGASLETALVQLCKSVEAEIKQKDTGKKREKEMSPLVVRAARSSLIASFLPLAIAFYCFLSTPEDLRLAVMRAVRMGIEPPLTCSLVGAMSGTYNSVLAIPVEWGIAVGKNSELGELGSGELKPASLKPLLWDTATVGDIRSLADHLLAVWSGVYHNSTNKPLSNPVVAATYLIRPH
jgi:ADP-ribosylglycohydrolase